MAEASSSPVVASSSKRLKEDVELIKARLVDNNFSMSRYADPLVARPPSDRQFWPKDATPETEKMWLAMIKELRAA